MIDLPEIAAQDAAHPLDVLDVDRPVEPHFAPDALDILESRLLAEHHDDRVAGDHADEQKNDR